MAVKKRTSNRPVSKAKKKPARASAINLNAILEEKLSTHPIGKALSAIDILYKELDDMQLRLDILITRISILKKRTSSLRKGELITLQTMTSLLDNKNGSQVGLKTPKTGSDTTINEDKGKVEWTKLRLLKETTINDVLLESGAVVSIESNAAASLVEQGDAEAIDVPPEEAKEE